MSVQVSADGAGNRCFGSCIVEISWESSQSENESAVCPLIAEQPLMSDMPVTTIRWDHLDHSFHFSDVGDPR